MKTTLKHHGSPETITDGLGAYRAAMTDLCCEQKQANGR